MERIDGIREQLCNIVQGCEVGEFEQFLYDLRNTEAFSNYIIGILESFDMGHFRGVSDQEMSEMMNSGKYSEKFIEWLGEEV